jgi:hypothetical protein
MLKILSTRERFFPLIERSQLKNLKERKQRVKTSLTRELRSDFEF